METNQPLQLEDPLETLGVDSKAGDEEIRAAYLAKIKEYPPSRFPERFEQLSLAYEQIKSPLKRAEFALLREDPERPLVSLLFQGQRPTREFVSCDLWTQVLHPSKN